jgi:hypothetical protein
MFQSYWGSRALKVYSYVLFLLLITHSFVSYVFDTSEDNKAFAYIIFVALIYGTPLIFGLLMVHYSRNTPLGLRVFFTLAASGVVVVALPFSVIILGCELGLDCI